MREGDIVRITNEKASCRGPRVFLALVECWNPPDEESEGHWIYKTINGDLFTADDAIAIEIVEL